MSKRYGPWTQLRSRIAYRNPWLSIQEDKVIQPNGKRSTYAFLKKAPAIFVVAFTGKEIYLLQQFRYVLKKAIYEIPAGSVTGKAVLKNAKRELFEETGLRAQRWTRLGKHYDAPGHESAYITTYLAEDLDESSVHTRGQEGDESILSISKVSLPRLRTMIMHGKIECGLTLASLNYFFTYLRTVRHQNV
ncbi:MAG: NUDIX hydrolase [Patescibacteria group bacterium]